MMAGFGLIPADISTSITVDICAIAFVWRTAHVMSRHSRRTLAIRQAIDNFFRQQRATASNFLSRSRDNPRGARTFISFGCLGDQELVILSRKDCDFATRRFLKSNNHDVLAVVNFSSVPYRGHDNCSLI